MLNFLILITTLRGGRWTGQSGREVVGLASEVDGQRGGAERAAHDSVLIKGPQESSARPVTPLDICNVIRGKLKKEKGERREELGRSPGTCHGPLGPPAARSPHDRQPPPRLSETVSVSKERDTSPCHRSAEVTKCHH